MDPNAPNNISPQEYQQFLQWRQQQQQQQQAPPPPPPQQPMAFQSQYAPMSVSQRIDNMADRLFQRVYKDAVNRLRSHVQQAPPPPPPQQPVAFQPQFAPMATFVESRFQHNFNQMGQTPLQADSGPSQVQQPQFNQLQSPAAPQSGGGLFGTQQPQFNQPQGFAAAQYDGGPFQVQQPQYNQPQSFTAPRLMAPPIPAPQQSFPPAEGRSPSASHGNWNPLLGEGALPRNQSPPVKLEPDDENNGANQSPPIKSEPDNESNGASRSIWSRSEGSTGRNGSRLTSAQRRERRRRARNRQYTTSRRGRYQ